MGEIRADVHVVWPARAGQWSKEVVVCSIEAAISQGYDGIVVCPVFDGTAGIIDDAVGTGIPVIMMIAEGQAPSKRMTYVGQNNCAASGELGKLVAQMCAARASWALITGYFGAGQHEGRMGGTVGNLKDNHPDIEIIGPFENKDTGEQAFSLTQDMLTRHLDLGAAYVVAGVPSGAAQAVQDQRLTGEVGVVAFDHTPENPATSTS
ncbi:MAG: substrate-binding domain-containing protein [Rhodobacteraceae bacterium]|nr:substrate-binding domain-containing protein [Paracoccaceae bacterium]